MKGLFDLDAPVWVWLSEVADVMILSLYWWICSIPLVTVGASTTALYYVLGKKMRKESTSITRDFFYSFKMNFKQSLPLAIIFLIAVISGSLYVFMAVDGLLNDNLKGVMRFIVPVGMVFIFEATHLSSYIWALLSRFHMKSYTLFTTAFVLVHRHLLTTIILTVAKIAVLLAIFKMPLIVLVAPGINVAIDSFFVQGIFSRYLEVEATKNAQAEELEEEDYMETTNEQQ
ncbi:YesL family protein [Sporanaerobium hydrogeniformans]|uniref:YesL family protein n=1 Tax=Sporanaerobium hydrogeniformans TaxID=3072179 RepID=UPI0015D51B93|nr:YesL family protein [Sporanaerobium hydrogeniformans]